MEIYCHRSRVGEVSLAEEYVSKGGVQIIQARILFRVQFIIDHSILGQKCCFCD